MIVLVQKNETKILNDSRVRLSRINWRLREFLDHLLPPSFFFAKNQRVHLFEKHPPTLNISFRHGEYPMGGDLSELEFIQVRARLVEDFVAILGAGRQSLVQECLIYLPSF